MRPVAPNLSYVPQTGNAELDRYLHNIRDTFAVRGGDRNPLDKYLTVRDFLGALEAAGIATEAARAALTNQ